MPPTLDDVRRLLCDAMAMAEDTPDWLEQAAARLYAERVREKPFQRQYDVSTVGARLRTAREALGLSQPQAAIRLGRITQPNLSHMENGKRNLPVDCVGTVCAVYGITKEWLLGQSEAGGPPIPREQLRRHVTKRWRQRQDFLTQRAKARAEVKRLNARYQAEVKTK